MVIEMATKTIKITYDEEAMDINKGFIDGLLSDYLGIEKIEIVNS